ncbi:MAG: hypothetical protein J6S67_00655 [Methanobrevibacter sp.]|nr:hypothetical protein [Methanobrevibacter sp.]
MTSEEEYRQAIKNYVLGKKVFDLFDMAIEKCKKEIGKTDQEIHLSKIPNYRELVSSLAPMLQNRQSPKQIYMSPIMAYAIDSLSNDTLLATNEKPELLISDLRVHKTLAVDDNTIYALPDPDLVGVMAVPRFGILPLKDIVCLENYADFPDSIEENSLLRLINIEAPYKITVPQRWIDDYKNITD